MAPLDYAQSLGWFIDQTLIISSFETSDFLRIFGSFSMYLVAERPLVSSWLLKLGVFQKACEATLRSRLSGKLSYGIVWEREIILGLQTITVTVIYSYGTITD